MDGLLEIMSEMVAKYTDVSKRLAEVTKEHVTDQELLLKQSQFLAQWSKEIDRLKAEIVTLKSSNDQLYNLQDKAMMKYMQLLGWLPEETRNKWFAKIGGATSSAPGAPPA